MEKCVELVLKLEECDDALLTIFFWSSLEKCAEVVLKLEKCVDANLNCKFLEKWEKCVESRQNLKFVKEIERNAWKSLEVES